MTRLKEGLLAAINSSSGADATDSPEQFLECFIPAEASLAAKMLGREGLLLPKSPPSNEMMSLLELAQH